jgi:hypothetical protein
MQNPIKQHFGAAKKVLRYIAGTKCHEIWYSNITSFNLCGYSDTDWAGCAEDRRSTTDYIFSLGTGANLKIF